MDHRQGCLLYLYHFSSRFLLRGSSAIFSPRDHLLGMIKTSLAILAAYARSSFDVEVGVARLSLCEPICRLALSSALALSRTDASWATSANSSAAIWWSTRHCRIRSPLPDSSKSEKSVSVSPALRRSKLHWMSRRRHSLQGPPSDCGLQAT